MRRKELLSLYTLERKIDPHTGKEKTVSRYIGPWYTADKKACRTCAVKTLMGCVLAAAAFVTAGIIPCWTALNNYVAPWHIACLLPLMYMILGAVKLLRLKERFDHVDRSESAERIKASALGMAILGGAWSVSAGISLLLSAHPLKGREETLAVLAARLAGMSWLNEGIYIACGLVMVLVGTLVCLAARRLVIRREEPTQKDAAQEAAPGIAEKQITSCPEDS